jgi:spermidine/putrescine transport system ATP-binding protein
LADTSVAIREVEKAYGGVRAVDGVSLEIRRGEFFSILGPSGSGKTTLLRLLAGFERPDRGEILIEGRSMRDVPPNRRPVNLVFQHYALFPHLTAFRNVAFGLEMQRRPRPEIDARARAALAMVRLHEHHDRYPAQLSGGEQQRVALARALVNRPALVLLDEPLGALDQQLRRDMQVELKTIQEEAGITFVCVTHDQDEALTLSDRLAVMSGGRVLQVGSPRELYAAPATAAVARFLGRSNCLAGRVAAVEGERCLFVATDRPGLPPLRARRPRGPGPGEAATLVLRPEALLLARERGGEPADNLLPGRVRKAIYGGSETQYLVDLDGGPTWLALAPNGRSDAKPFEAGEAVLVQWDAEEGAVLAE